MRSCRSGCRAPAPGPGAVRLEDDPIQKGRAAMAFAARLAPLKAGTAEAETQPLSASHARRPHCRNSSGRCPLDGTFQQGGDVGVGRFGRGTMMYFVQPGARDLRPKQRQLCVLRHGPVVVQPGHSPTATTSGRRRGQGLSSQRPSRRQRPRQWAFSPQGLPSPLASRIASILPPRDGCRWHTHHG